MPLDPGIATVAVVGLGETGLPTALALHRQGVEVVGLDSSPARLAAIRGRSVVLLPDDREQLDTALAEPGFRVTDDEECLTGADAVVICTDVDLRLLAGACAAVVDRARRGQVLVLTASTYVGCTEDLLVTPLAERGLRAGDDVFIAFSPERIDPCAGEPSTPPRVLGGVTPVCAQSARGVIGLVAEELHVVGSAEAAEATAL